MRIFRRFAFLTLIILQSLPLFSQPEEGNVLEGKTIAVFLSKKNFEFGENYLLPLSQFIKAEEGKRTDVEDIKRQTLIVIGDLFCQQSEYGMDADSVYFLSEYPDLAYEFLDKYSSSLNYLKPLDSLFGDTDYILVVNPFILGSYRVSSVYSRSNRIITEKVMVMTARARFTLFEPRSGKIARQVIVCADERKTKIPLDLYDFNSKESKTGKFLANLFSLGISSLRGIPGGECETE